MDRLPAIFVGHGAPDLAIKDIPAHHFLKALGAQLPAPKAILAVSAHWETANPTVSLAEHPETIYDFGGFDPSLRDIVYDANGAPDLAKRVADLIPEVDYNDHRGLDHGAWVPLHLMYPDRNIPVTQLSVMPDADGRFHYDLGRKLRPLRDEGVLILATGGVVHNLSRIARDGGDPPEWAVSFDDWVHDRVTQGDVDGLSDYQSHPLGLTAQPTPEHFMPLFVAMGAGDDDGKGTELHRSFSYGSISMAAYQFA